mmetsp:Transcript_38805/g.109756  ORF Transcript_38805/g.109756 Transcript_38805/m.109756 type:complete len:258 (-) Transcript_38805:131-904(-)
MMSPMSIQGTPSRQWPSLKNTARAEEGTFVAEESSHVFSSQEEERAPNFSFNPDAKEFTFNPAATEFLNPAANEFNDFVPFPQMPLFEPAKAPEFKLTFPPGQLGRARRLEDIIDAALAKVVAEDQPVNERAVWPTKAELCSEALGQPDLSLAPFAEIEPLDLGGFPEQLMGPCFEMCPEFAGMATPMTNSSGMVLCMPMNSDAGVCHPFMFPCGDQGFAQLDATGESSSAPHDASFREELLLSCLAEAESCIASCA